MFYEELDFIKIDLEKLKEEVKKSVFTLGDRVVQGEEFETPQYCGFGGWSILSRTGDWRDGFAFFQNEEGTVLEETFFPKDKENYATLKYFDIAHSLEYNKPTQAYVGALKELIEQIASFGLNPTRVRITCLKAGCKSLVHRDGGDDEYIARLHIPLWTNEKCVFICEGQNLHMEAGKAHLIMASKWHQIRNDSDEDRYHILMDVYDTKKVTKHFPYDADFALLEDFAKGMREKIDACVITPEDLALFDSVRDSYITNPHFTKK